MPVFNRWRRFASGFFRNDAATPRGHAGYGMLRIAAFLGGAACGVRGLAMKVEPIHT